MNTQGKYNLIYRLGLRKDFRDHYDKGDTEFDKIIRTGTIDMPEIAATIFAGLSRMYELGDGESPNFESPKIGPKVAAVDKKFGAGVEISEQTIQDDQYGKMKEAAKWLAHAARMTKEYRVAAFWDDAFTGSVYKGIDGLSLCNASHTYLNASGTFSNVPSAPVGLGRAGFDALLDLFMTAKDHNGDPISLTPKKLIIGNNTGDYQRALQILKGIKEPFTANNADNGVRLTTPSLDQVIVSRFKSSLKSYFMVDDSWFDAWMLMRSDASVEDDRDFKTGAYLWKSTMRFLIWFVDNRGVVGVNPS